MTLATKITIARILLIPVFVTLANAYGESIRSGAPDDRFRWAAILTFIIASLSDAVDGFIARRFNQTSRLGSILDPIADKGLLLAAVITLTVADWPIRFPIWFPALVISKEAVTVGGAFIVNHLAGDVRIRPHWTGKTCTFLQMLALSWLMLSASFPASINPQLVADILIGLAAIFTVIAGVLYVMDGAHQISSTDSNHVEPAK